MAKKKPVTEADRLAHRCPTCHVPPGVRCIDPKRDETPRCHRTRGPGEHERHLQERIDRQTARQRASYGPLFQDLAAAEVRVPTVAEVMHADRMAAARSFDATGGPGGLALCDKANAGLQWLVIHSMIREVGRRCGDNWYRAIRAAVLEGFGNGIEYVPYRMRKLLTTTEPYTLAYRRVPDPTKSIGFRVEPLMTWAPVEPLMTPEEFDARFKMPDHFKGWQDRPEPAGADEQFRAAFAWANGG